MNIVKAPFIIIHVSSSISAKMVTEMVTFSLKADANLSDPTSPASKLVVNFLVAELTAHRAHNAYYGQYIEKPETGILFVNWDSLEAHKKFMSSP